MKNICVFCGSNPGADPAYLQIASRLGEEIASRRFGLVYGGSNLGLMGAVAKSALESGSNVIGVMPKVFEGRVQHPDLNKIIITDTMHQRKAKMFEISDGFIALPGGFGTFEELLEMLTWSQIGYSTKPCGILNVNGYYDGLLKFFDKAVEMRFVKKEHRNAIIVDIYPKNILDKFEKYKPVTLDKWIDR
ncbi:MAG: TIGR00730 family Rossman fold protein [Candidatus Tenebribacter burtonii]|jgi:uncharacterized protein (TIGR00730 family)|nr:TIGR00730 family Rossman fold protein [Candidatus Tenebribacter burtonii]